ncbi:putative bifunctional diguanylate cyclase/phosphodiesterase [Roseomonas sp. USHLN139]|uniref:putative bifunctional diguanylate cyclase/phosphodiesterase n=1 Tax=Roseomonas sp. USHLN139 TaxID=3081298 RepID=UPI003B01E9E0
MLILAVCLAAYGLASSLDAYEAIQHFVEAHEDWQLDELLTLAFILPFGLAAYALRRNREQRRERASRHRAEAALRRAAAEDPLTGLPNRRQLSEALVARLASGVPLALYRLDLDRFRLVNDLHGPALGDRLLRQVALRLRAALPDSGLVARVGGDEFLLLMPCDSAAAAETMARRLAALLRRPFRLQGQRLRLSASIGIALAPADGQQAGLLQHRAELALQRAKAEARGSLRRFTPGMEAAAQAAAELLAELPEAIEQGAIEPYFQPLVALPARRLIGFEVLARWPHAQRGMISPACFIPLAEEAGLIGPLTEALLRRACLAARDWPLPLSIAVNLSALQLSDEGLTPRLEDILVETGLDPARLELELTESVLIGDLDRARAVLLRLKQRGLRLALDDFGTGHSSLSHLRALPFDKIKIDASFVGRMSEQPECRSIVAAVIAMAASLGMATVAEGVEREAEAALLDDLGCAIGQGWLFGRPMPVAAVLALLSAPAARSAAQPAALGR